MSVSAIHANQNIMAVKLMRQVANTKGTLKVSSFVLAWELFECVLTSFTKISHARVTHTSCLKIANKLKNTQCLERRAT